MNQTLITKALAAVTIITGSVFSGAQTADAASFDHIDHLAKDIQVKSRELIREVQVHYRHTAAYRHMISDAWQMYRKASHIHGLAHCTTSLSHMDRDLDDLDALVHHFQDLVRDVNRNPRFGHIHGSPCHVPELLDAIADCVHHMQADVRELRNARRRTSFYGRGIGTYNSHYGLPAPSSCSLRPSYGRPVPSYNYGYGSGVSINNGRVSFRFGW